MKINTKTSIDLSVESTSLIIGVFTNKKPSLFVELDQLLEGKLTMMLEKDSIPTKYSELTPLVPLGIIQSSKIYVVGLGNFDEYDLEKSRKVMGKIAKQIKEEAIILLDSFLPQGQMIHELALIAAESILLGSYEFAAYKTETKNSNFGGFCFYSEVKIEKEVKEGMIYAEAVNHARDLFNEPSNKLTATVLAAKVKNFSEQYGLEYQIIEKEEMKHLNMGGILGVNRASTEPPKMIVAKYRGNSNIEEFTALIGKGLTFDSGGYCLKTSGGMKMSKGDMGGAASAYGAFEAAVRLQLPVNLLLVIPSTDNMISADAIKPGDVLEMMNGKTVEVTNTDAEGRLILADAITLAKQLGATRIINLATLTGAIAVALGGRITGAFTNDQPYLDGLIAASKLTHEQLWQMPLTSSDQEDLRISQVADLDNSPTGKPGAIIAAAFLKEFVEETPWIHLDIAGTADTNTEHDLGPKGATGVMVRTIAKYLSN